jgi:hypothetical protein
MPGALAVCIITGTIFLILLYGAGFIFHIEEIKLIVQKIRKHSRFQSRTEKNGAEHNHIVKTP